MGDPYGKYGRKIINSRSIHAVGDSRRWERPPSAPLAVRTPVASRDIDFTLIGRLIPGHQNPVTKQYEPPCYEPVSDTERSFLRDLLPHLPDAVRQHGKLVDILDVAAGTSEGHTVTYCTGDSRWERVDVTLGTLAEWAGDVLTQHGYPLELEAC